MLLRSFIYTHLKFRTRFFATNYQLIGPYLLDHKIVTLTSFLTPSMQILNWSSFLIYKNLSVLLVTCKKCNGLVEENKSQKNMMLFTYFYSLSCKAKKINKPFISSLSICKSVVKKPTHLCSFQEFVINQMTVLTLNGIIYFVFFAFL